MIKRMVYYAQLKDVLYDMAYFKARKNKISMLKNRNKLITFSLFRHDGQLFLYYETNDYDIKPEDMFEDGGKYLKQFPDNYEKYWVFMNDIYHNDKPLDYDYWKRKTEPEKYIGRLAYLKPEMVSSYIFYHYQNQEERPCSENRTQIISIYENMLFYYYELPAVIVEPSYKGSLATNLTPENWGGLMEQHFKPWNENGNSYSWKNIECIFAV